MDVSVVEELVGEMEGECRRRHGSVDAEEIDEVRAEIIEELVAMKCRSSYHGECFRDTMFSDSHDFAAVFSPGAIHLKSFLPDIGSGTDVLGIDAFCTQLPECASVLAEAMSPDVRCFGVSGFEKSGRWADLSDDSLEEYVQEYWKYAVDDVNGGALDLEKVREARKEEIEFMRCKGIWREVPWSEAMNKTGKPPVTVKWVDTMKSGGLIRSRLVARDFRTKGEKDREDLFAATPPLELLKALISKAAGCKARKILVIDVKKAHLYPLCTQDVYIELPEEAGAGPGVCGKLEHWLYGFRPAAQAWENHYSRNLEQEGFKRGAASPVSFWNPKTDVSCLVHGDDFTVVGEDKHLDEIETRMKEWYEVKIKARLGPGSNDAKEIEVLGRKIRCTAKGYEYEADSSHRAKILEALGLDEKSKELSVTGRTEELANDEEELQGPEATSFRAMAARLNYLAQDSPDIQYAAKEVCRQMARPTAESWRKLKALARFVLGRRSVVWQFEWQNEVPELRLFTDSDWAGCRRTRRSTSGGLVMIGAHCVKTWSSTQAPVALSSAEAEYYSMVEGGTRAIGLRNMLEELGVLVRGPVVLHSDSSAARSFASRRGVGRMRHLEVRHLWLQAEVSGQRVVLCRVAGEANPADLLTKYLSRKEIEKHLAKMSVIMIARNLEEAAAEGGCQPSPTLQRLGCKFERPHTQQGEGDHCLSLCLCSACSLLASNCSCLCPHGASQYLAPCGSSR
jgi:hypothetical protein